MKTCFLFLNPKNFRKLYKVQTLSKVKKKIILRKLTILNWKNLKDNDFWRENFGLFYGNSQVSPYSCFSYAWSLIQIYLNLRIISISCMKIHLQILKKISRLD